MLQDFSSAFGEIDSAIQRHTESLSAGSGGGDATAAGSGGGGSRNVNTNGDTNGNANTDGNTNGNINANGNMNGNVNANGNGNRNAIIVINSRRDAAVAEPRSSFRTPQAESNASKYVRSPLAQVGPAVPGPAEQLNNSVGGNGRVPKGTGNAGGIGRIPAGGRGTERAGYGDGRGNMIVEGSSNGPERSTGHKRLRT